MRYSKVNIKLMIGAAMVLLVTAYVVTSILWPSFDANGMDYGALLQRPSTGHLFGTDNFGRDICVRVAQGAATTFGIALLTVLIGAGVGTVIGALTGYFGGPVDELLMRVNDCLASFPGILLALVAVSILDVGTLNICLALGVVFIPGYVRIMRGEFLNERDRDYVMSAKLMGASNIRIMFVHILPNTRKILLSSILVGLNNAVLAEAGLSYLGLGVQPPDPSLGRMLAEAQVYILSAPWYVISVCGVMVIALLGLSMISDNFGVSGVNLRRVKHRADELRLAGSSDNDMACHADEQATPADASQGTGSPILRVEGLTVEYIEDNGPDRTLDEVSFAVQEHEILGIVGESGSGKSLTALSIMGILPDKACMTGGAIYLRDRRLDALDEDAYCGVRGKDIAMIFQEPMTSLNPLMTVSEQLREVIVLHRSEDAPTQEPEESRIISALQAAGLKGAWVIKDKYPHELSGGMRQRVMIAMAILSGASVIIADEPTTALDADVAEGIITLFADINRRFGTAIVLITHDLKIVNRICDRAIVMKDGRIEEELTRTSEEGLSKPHTEYGSKLFEAAYSTHDYRTHEPQTEQGPIVQLRDVSVAYRERGRLFGRAKLKTVISGIDLRVIRGETFGLVGASGSGKTTLVKAIAGLSGYTTGELTLDCSRTGMVFQDPAGSLNPAMSVRRILEEPLRIGTGMSKSERTARIDDILEAVSLEKEVLPRRVRELSGGQKQRLSIAVNLLLRPELIILDEPVSALDVTLREQVLELLMKLKASYGLTYILISHDRELIARTCDHVYSL